MNTMNKYPEIEITEISRVAEIVEMAVADPTYLDPGVCPYDEDAILKLRQMVDWLHPTARASLDNPERKTAGRPTKKTLIPLDEVEKEVDDIRKEIAQLKTDARGLETADRIQIIKTRAALVEKIIAMKERINSQKKQQSFVAEVIAIMEDILEQSQREEMIKRLEPYSED